MRPLFSILIFFTILASLRAQDLAGDINRFNASIAARDAKYISATVRVLDSKVSPKETLVGKMELWQSGNDCFYKFLDVEVIQNGQYLLYLDHAEKSIEVHPPASPDGVLGQYTPEAVNGFIAHAQGSKPIHSMAGCNGYRLEYGPMQDGLEAIEIFFETNTGNLKEIRYCYKFYDWVTDDRSTYQTKITYDEYSFVKEVPPAKFAVGHIVRNNNGKIIPVSAYGKYSLWVEETLKNKP